MTSRSEFAAAIFTRGVSVVTKVREPIGGISLLMRLTGP